MHINMMDLNQLLLAGGQKESGDPKNVGSLGKEGGPGGKGSSVDDQK